MNVYSVKLMTVIVTALIDSINPCAIGVLILLVTSLLSLSKNKTKMLLAGLLYISAVYITYFLAGIGLLVFIQRFQIAELVGVIVGGLVIILGLVELKDFLFKNEVFTLSMSAKHANYIKKKVKKASIPILIFLGFFVAAVELPCTGGPYLAITALLAKDFNIMAIYYLLLYNFIFVLPLIVILVLAYIGTSVDVIKKWKKKNRRYMKLGIGLVMVALGVLLIMYSTGYIELQGFSPASIPAEKTAFMIGQYFS